ncbi:hypothetical protein BJ165DRAFT_1492980 [Panaeolus papilionaceus]|nr:hypothetical protein BJ165DRAFT_1492980 [Panaeolus papilionaceus]
MRRGIGVGTGRGYIVFICVCVGVMVCRIERQGTILSAPRCTLFVKLNLNRDVFLSKLFSGSCSK